jgi:hypothetical protein
MRAQLELNGLQRAPQRRDLLTDLAVLGVAGVAGLLAAGAVSLGLALFFARWFSPWISAFAAAGVWGLVALQALRHDRARRVLRAILPEQDDDAVAAAQAELLARIDAMRATSRALARAAEREFVARQKVAVENALRDLLGVMLAPARAVLRR